MTIYTISDDMMRILNMLEQQPEDETEEQALKDTLEMIKMDFAEKADGYGKVLRQLQAEAEAVKAEKIRLSQRQSTLEKNAERLKETMKQAMIMTGQKKVKTDLFTFSTRAGKELVIDTDNVFEIPDELLRYKDPEPDKAAIKEYLKTNECSWAHMAETQSLIVK